MRGRRGGWRCRGYGRRPTEIAAGKSLEHRKIARVPHLRARAEREREIVIAFLAIGDRFPVAALVASGRKAVGLQMLAVRVRDVVQPVDPQAGIVDPERCLVRGDERTKAPRNARFGDGVRVHHRIGTREARAIGREDGEMISRAHRGVLVPVPWRCDFRPCVEPRGARYRCFHDLGGGRQREGREQQKHTADPSRYPTKRHYFRSWNFFPSATIFSSNALGLKTSPIWLCHSFIFARTLSRPTVSP